MFYILALGLTPGQIQPLVYLTVKPTVTAFKGKVADQRVDGPAHMPQVE